MKWLPLILVGIVTSVVEPANSRGQPQTKPGKEKLNGDWFMISGNCHGDVATIFGQVPEPERTRILTFSDSAMKLTIDGESVAGSYILDSTKAPKAVDLTFPLRDGKATCRGIYELKGDVLRICFDGSEASWRFVAYRESGTLKMLDDDATRKRFHRPGLLSQAWKGEK